MYSHVSEIYGKKRCVYQRQSLTTTDFINIKYKKCGKKKVIKVDQIPTEGNRGVKLKTIKGIEE